MFSSDAKPGECLAIKTSYYSSWLAANDFMDTSRDITTENISFQLTLKDCDAQDATQRWLLGDDDRIHSVANYDLCWTVDSDAQGVLLAEGAPVTLTSCTSDEDEIAHRQRLQLITRSSSGEMATVEPFLHSVQAEYMVDDMVRLAFWTNEDISNKDIMDTLTQKVQTLEIFQAQDIVDTLQDLGSAKDVIGTLESMTESNPVYTVSVSSWANVIEIPASELIASTTVENKENSPVSFVARMGSAQSMAFTINPDLIVHCGILGRSAFRGGSSPALAIALSVVGVAILAIFLAMCHKKKRDTTSISKTESPGMEGGNEKPVDASEDDAVSTDDDETVEGDSVVEG